MDSSNHWYGHAHILAEYCGFDVDIPPPIWGVVAHGWNVLHGFGPGHRPPTSYPKYVWSPSSAIRGAAIGWDDYVVIGAPWLYLLRQRLPQPSAERSGTIFYPFHAWEESRVEGDHEALIREVLETEEGPVTVCLYHVEYAMPSVRRVYEDVGVRVVCHGERGTYRVGTDREFLNRQLDELLRHRRVVSNRLTTAVLYGASVGCEVGVYGNPMTYVEQRAGVSKSRDWNAAVERWFPEMHGRFIDPAVSEAFAARELGSDHLLDPNALASALGWIS